MEQIYNKLVRDKIPEKIEKNGEIPITSILNDNEYKRELEKKLYEEYNEVISASGKDRIEELADMLEVIKSLANIEGKSLEDVIKVSSEKREKRGGFDNRIFLKKVLTKDAK